MIYSNGAVFAECVRFDGQEV